LTVLSRSEDVSDDVSESVATELDLSLSNLLVLLEVFVRGSFVLFDVGVSVLRTGLVGFFTPDIDV